MTDQRDDRGQVDTSGVLDGQNAMDVYKLRQQTIVTLERLLADAQTEIEMMRGSTSWRITAPLRAAGRFGRRLTGRS